jgi:hypothetical protein
MLGNVLQAKYGYLQEFCKLQIYVANYRAAFTRQRSLVRTQHRPLSRYFVLQEKRKGKEELGTCTWVFLHRSDNSGSYVGWGLTIGHTLPAGATVESVTLDGKSTMARYRGHDPRPGGARQGFDGNVEHLDRDHRPHLCCDSQRGAYPSTPCIGTTPHVNTELVVATEELPEKFSLLLGARSL